MPLIEEANRFELSDVESSLPAVEVNVFSTDIS